MNNEEKEQLRESWEEELSEILFSLDKCVGCDGLGKIYNLMSTSPNEICLMCRGEGHEPKGLKKVKSFIRSLLSKDRAEQEKERWTKSCAGCPKGHDSFWKTVVESPQWEKWGKEQSKRLSSGVMKDVFDFDECTECGWISQNHFQSFMKYVRELDRAERDGELVKRIGQMERASLAKGTECSDYDIAWNDALDFVITNIKNRVGFNR